MNIEKILLKRAVNIRDEPFTFTSGMKSPIYIDNRILISFPDDREKVIQMLLEKVRDLDFDVVAGVATAGIHWAAWIARSLEKPMIYIRGKPKGHGRQNQIEGFFERGSRVLVVEDHISTGGSVNEAIAAVKEAAGIVEDCIAVTTYEYGEVDARLHTLTTFTKLVEEASKTHEFDIAKVLAWKEDPYSWS